MKMRLISAAIGLPLLLILLVNVFSSCSKSHNNTPVAGLMTFNLAPDRGPVVITLSGNRLPGFPLQYLDYSGVYLNIYAANRSVVTYDYFSGNVIASSAYSFEQDKYYSQFIVGANSFYRNFIVIDNLDSLVSTAAASGKAYIRYVNAIPDSSKPLVTIVANGTTVISNNAGFATVSGFVAVSPGPVDIAVTNGGTIHGNRTITVDPLKVYTVMLTGLPNSPEASRTVKIKYVVNGILSSKTARQDSAAVGNSN